MGFVIILHLHTNGIVTKLSKMNNQTKHIFNFYVWPSRLPKICLAMNGMFKICPSWLTHETKEYSHVIRSNIMNKDNSLIPSVHEDSLMDTPNLNTLLAQIMI